MTTRINATYGVISLAFKTNPMTVKRKVFMIKSADVNRIKRMKRRGAEKQKKEMTNINIKEDTLLNE